MVITRFLAVGIACVLIALAPASAQLSIESISLAHSVEGGGTPLDTNHFFHHVSLSTSHFEAQLQGDQSGVLRSGATQDFMTLNHELEVVVSVGPIPVQLTNFRMGFTGKLVAADGRPSSSVDMRYDLRLRMMSEEGDTIGFLQALSPEFTETGFYEIDILAASLSSFGPRYLGAGLSYVFMLDGELNCGPVNSGIPTSFTVEAGGQYSPVYAGVFLEFDVATIPPPGAPALAGCVALLLSPRRRRLE